METLRFLGVSTAVFVTLAALYVAAFAIGWGQSTEYPDALADVYVVKTGIAVETPSPRWVIIGGSSAWFGFDSELLARATDKDVVNLGLHAEVPLWFQLEQVERLARPGDSIVLAEELIHYWRAQPTTYGVAKLSVLAPDLLAESTWSRRWELLTNTPPSHVFARLVARAACVTTLAASRRATLWSNVRAAWAGVHRSPLPGGYNALELTPRGDFGRPRSRADHVREDYGLNVPHAVAPQIWCDLAAAQRRLAAKGARCLFVWPPFEQHAGVDFRSVQAQTNLAQIRERLAAAGWRQVGTLDDAIFPEEFFYDTGYHLTTEGARERTRRLIESARLVSDQQAQ